MVQILEKLNQGDKLNLKALAEEFNGDLRAIQRDLNERFAFFLLEKIKGLYHRHLAFLDKPIRIISPDRLQGALGTHFAANVCSIKPLLIYEHRT